MKLTLKWWQNCGRNRTGSRTEPKSELTDKQWFLIADLFENPDPSPAGGRPRVDPRRCFEGIAWVLRTGARWKDLPKSFPSPATYWRRHFEWTERGLLEEAWRRLLLRLDGRGRLRLDEAFADGTFANAKRGVKRSA